jgi:hypothetical protein
MSNNRERTRRQVVPPLWNQMSKLERRFWTFHLQTPQVLTLLIQIGRRLIAEGNQKINVNHLFHEIRKDHMLRVSDNFTAFYARLLVVQYPEFALRIKLRPQRTQTSFGPVNSTLWSENYLVD